MVQLTDIYEHLLSEPSVLQPDTISYRLNVRKQDQ